MMNEAEKISEDEEEEVDSGKWVCVESILEEEPGGAVLAGRQFILATPVPMKRYLGDSSD